MAPRRDRTPPSQETPEEDYAEGGEGGEGGGMEDNRDVFEKALDYAPTIGMFVGGALGLRSGSKAAAKIDKKLKSVTKRWDDLRSKNQIKGLSPEEGVKMYKLEKEIKRVEQDLAGNLTSRMLLKGPAGAIVGSYAGDAARGAGQKRRK